LVWEEKPNSKNNGKLSDNYRWKNVNFHLLPLPQWAIFYFLKRVGLVIIGP
jgi:hypothetical protein